MKCLTIFLMLLSSVISCSSDHFKNYEGHVYLREMPLADAHVFEKDDPVHVTTTDRDGFFRLRKRENRVSNFLLVKDHGGMILDSIQVVRISGGEQIRYYFTEQTRDTLFIQR